MGSGRAYLFQETKVKKTPSAPYRPAKEKNNPKKRRYVLCTSFLGFVVEEGKEKDPSKSSAVASNSEVRETLSRGEVGFTVVSFHSVYQA